MAFNNTHKRELHISKTNGSNYINLLPLNCELKFTTNTDDVTRLSNKFSTKGYLQTQKTADLSFEILANDTDPAVLLLFELVTLKIDSYFKYKNEAGMEYAGQFLIKDMNYIHDNEKKNRLKVTAVTSGNITGV